MTLRKPQDETRTGVMYALLCYGLWGFTPLYFKAIDYVPALEMLAHRVVWSAVFLAILLWLKGRFHEIRPLVTDFSQLRWLLVSSLLISANWGLYIYTVMSGQILQASLGYYINPLVSVLLGMLFLKEGLRPVQWLAVLLAVGGTLNLAISYGEVPWLALALAFSFGFYGLVRKMAPAGPLVGLLVETLLVTPIALLYLAWLAEQGSGLFLAKDTYTDGMLLAAAFVTALPLLWFTNGAKRLRLSTMGLFQYIAPTMQFLLAVWLFKETFTVAHGVTFVLIWSALLIYTGDILRMQARLRHAPASAAK
ncbi:MAG: EamA family transporter RarD [Gammaproteobacteria bacterium]|nr:EamA family transporter RarD [Gammaproteobacteria bacterium]